METSKRVEIERRAALGRRAGEERRARMGAIGAELVRERRQRERRIVLRERIATARLVDWKARFDAALYGV